MVTRDSPENDLRRKVGKPFKRLSENRPRATPGKALDSAKSRFTFVFK